MSLFIYEDMEPEERVKVLARTALRKESMEFTRTLSEVDLVIEKDNYCRDGMRVASIKNELDAVKSRLTAEIKAIETGQAERLTIIASGKRQIFDDVYLILDQANKKVNYYDKRGEMVHSRNMNDEERQGRLFLDNEIAQPAPGVTVSDDNIEDIEHEEVDQNQPSNEESEDPIFEA